MAIPWLIGAATVAAVGVAAAMSDSDSSSSSDEEARARRSAERAREQKEKEQTIRQNIAKLEQAVDLLMNSYGVDEAEALSLLNSGDSAEYIPEDLNIALDDAKRELKLVKNALKNLEEIEHEL